MKILKINSYDRNTEIGEVIIFNGIYYKCIEGDCPDCCFAGVGFSCILEEKYNSITFPKNLTCCKVFGRKDNKFIRWIKYSYENKEKHKD